MEDLLGRGRPNEASRPPRGPSHAKTDCLRDTGVPAGVLSSDIPNRRISDAECQIEGTAWICSARKYVLKNTCPKIRVRFRHRNVARRSREAVDDRPAPLQRGRRRTPEAARGEVRQNRGTFNRVIHPHVPYPDRLPITSRSRRLKVNTRRHVRASSRRSGKNQSGPSRPA